MAHPDITLSKKTIHNPAEPRHFMRIKPVNGRVRIMSGEHVLADSEDALRLIEAGKDIYDPVIYMPFDDIAVTLHPLPSKTTHCPLKGDASYFALSEGGEAIAWTYSGAFDFASELKGHVAFYADRVTIEEKGFGAA